MHSDRSRSWHLEELAKVAAMSRNAFAVRFKSVTGIPLLTYLLNWRIRFAERSLRVGKTFMATFAQSLGYTSESAFSNAFRRLTAQRCSAQVLSRGKSRSLGFYPAPFEIGYAPNYQRLHPAPS
jgi:AraC-like DNA-binding protein